MTDIPKFISSLKISCLKRYCEKNINYDLASFQLAHIYTLGASLHKNWEIVNPFWKDTLIAWSDFMHSYDFEELEKTEIASQPIWLNHYFREPVLIFNDWFKKGIVTIKDLYDENGWIPFPRLQQLYDLKGTFLDYNRMFFNIPRSWRQNIDKNLHSSSNLTISPWIYDLTRSIKGTKVFYNKLIGNSLPLPKSCLKWENQLGCSFPWKQIFSVYCHGLRDTKLRDFQFRFIHKVIFTKRELLRMKLIDNDECSMCHTHKENVFHVYIECHVVKNFWSDFCIYLTHILHRKILITDNELLFGTSDVLINHLIVAAKRFIFVQCIKNENVDFVAFKNTIRSIYDVEYHIARRNNDFSAFNRKWALFPQTAK